MKAMEEVRATFRKNNDQGHLQYHQIEAIEEYDETDNQHSSVYAKRMG